MSGINISTEELEQLGKLLVDIDALKVNPNVHEPYCGNCNAWHAHAINSGMVLERGERGVCMCNDPTLIFVGATPCDGDAWGAAGDLLEIVQRARPLLNKLLEESRHG